MRQRGRAFSSCNVAKPTAIWRMGTGTGVSAANDSALTVQLTSLSQFSHPSRCCRRSTAKCENSHSIVSGWDSPFVIVSPASCRLSLALPRHYSLQTSMLVVALTQTLSETPSSLTYLNMSIPHVSPSSPLVEESSHLLQTLVKLLPD